MEPAGRRTLSASQDLSISEGEPWRDHLAERPAPARPAATAGANRSVIGRRRLIAGLLLVVVVGLAGGIAVILLRGAGQTPMTPVPSHHYARAHGDQPVAIAGPYHALNDEPDDHRAVEERCRARSRSPRERSSSGAKAMPL